MGQAVASAGRRLGVLLLLVSPACAWDWDRFEFPGTVCRWDDPAAFTLATPRPLAGVNSSGRDYEPFLSPDRLTLYFVSDRGDGRRRIYRAARARPYGAFEAVEPENGVSVPDAVYRLALSSDGLTAYIAAPSGYPASGAGQTDLFSATRPAAGAPLGSADFSPVSEVNTSNHEWDPFPSPDGLRLYYGEHVPPDLHHPRYAERAAPGQPWQRMGPVPGLPASPPFKTDNPAVTVDERLILFASDLTGSVAGSRDLWYAVRPGRDASFGPPRQVPEVNTEHLESEVYISPDGCELFFIRSEGAARKDDIYTTRHVER